MTIYIYIYIHLGSTNSGHSGAQTVDTPDHKQWTQQQKWTLERTHTTRIDTTNVTALRVWDEEQQEQEQPTRS